MASIDINGSPSFFNLKSTWTVGTVSNGALSITKSPTTVTQNVSFSINLPSGAIISSAYIHSEWGSPNTGYATRTVNGIKPSSDNNYNVPVTVNTTNGTVSYEFKFKANGSTSGGTGNHTGTASVSDIYLHIEYINPASNFTVDVSSVNAGGNITANINPVDSSYTHNMTVTFGSRSETIIGVGTTASYTIPLEWLDQIPNSTSGTATVKIDTLSGSTVLGSNSSTVTITCPDNIVPSVGTITTEVVSDERDIYIKGHSQCRIIVSDYMAGTGAAIENVYISGGGDSVYADTMLSSMLNNAGVITYTVTVTDTRGRSASDTVSIEVLDHEPITITGVVAYRCTSDGVADKASGKSLRLGCAYTISELDDIENEASVRVFWRVYGDDSWTEIKNWPDESGEEQTVLVDALELDTRYEVRFLVTDSMSRAEKIIIIPTGSVFMTWNKSKRKFGLGVYPENDNSFVINGDWTFMIGDKTIDEIINDRVNEILIAKGLISE